MILEIVKYGNPVLREKGREAKPTDEKIGELAAKALASIFSTTPKDGA